MLVWFGHVTAGFEILMPSAMTPSLARRRKVGAGNVGSANVYAGKPSRLMTITKRSFAGKVSIGERRREDAEPLNDATNKMGNRNVTIRRILDLNLA